MGFGDRLFWGIMSFIGVNLFWLGVLEEYLSIWFGAVLGVVALFSAIMYLPRPKTEESQSGE
jgi:predicted small integral membrane protein